MINYPKTPYQISTCVKVCMCMRSGTYSFYPRYYWSMMTPPKTVDPVRPELSDEIEWQLIERKKEEDTKNAINLDSWKIKYKLEKDNAIEARKIPQDHQ